MRGFSVTNGMDYKRLLDFEGESGGQSKTHTLSFTNANIGLGAACQIGPGRALILDSVGYCSSEMTTFNGFEAFGNGAIFPAYRYGQTAGILSPGIPMIVPKKSVIRHSSVGFGTTITNVTKAGVTAPTAIPFTFTQFTNGITITDDFNFDAPYILNIISDSIGDGSGMTSSLDMWAYQVRNFFLSKGVNIRLRNWSVSGSTLTQHEAAFRVGRYNYNEPGITIICLGTNDAGGNLGTVLSGSAQTTAQNSFQSIITQCQYLFPGQKVLVLGPATLGTAQNETNLASIAAGQQSYVNGLSTKQVQYIPRTAFTANATNLQADNVHPTAVGQGLIGTNVISYLNTPANEALKFL